MNYLYLFLGLLVAEAVTAQTVAYTEICDASAVNLLPNGQLVIADDESNTIRIYGQDANLKNRFHFEDFLGADEADIEGSARQGDLIYWVTSHGRNRKGKLRWARHQLFAAHWSENTEGVELRFAGRASNLATSLVQPSQWRNPVKNATVIRLITQGTQLLEKRVPGLAPKVGGLNIEALAMSKSGGLLIGLRNPLLQGKAIVIDLENPGSVLKGDAPRFGDAYTLALGNRGLRAMTRDKDRYLLVAGPMDSETNFALYAWNGRADGKPNLLRILPNQPGINPEGIAIGPKGFLIVNDEGSRTIGDERCKDSPPAHRSFTSILLAPNQKPTPPPAKKAASQPTAKAATSQPTAPSSP